jgi:hypothetical protein
MYNQKVTVKSPPSYGAVKEVVIGLSGPVVAWAFEIITAGTGTPIVLNRKL